MSVVNNYGGTWSGTYVLTTCDNSGMFSTYGWCRDLGGIGMTLPFSLGLDQTVSSDRTKLAGTLTIGSLGGSISGNVTGGWPISVRVCVINADGHEIGGCQVTDGLWAVTVVPGAFTLRAVDLGRAYIGGWWTADGPVATMAGATRTAIISVAMQLVS